MTAATHHEPRPWKQAIFWLCFLGPFFFTTYGFANWWTSRLPHVDAYVMDWEHRIPFQAWTIIPYWSEDLFYAGSVFLCATQAELRIHTRRLLTASAISVAGFLLFPLRFSFPRPETNGLAGLMFDSLTSFDKPFNQAPSLHISLLLILWVRYAKHLPGGWRWLLHIWFALIGISVLTTYQHHFIDLITGAWVGVIVLYLLPEAPHRWQWRPARTSLAHQRLARLYGIGGLLLSAAAVLSGGAAWWLLWPGVALLLVAAAYRGLGVSVFQKSNGRFSLAATVILLPYLLGAWLSMRLYTRRMASHVEISDGVWIGHWPHRGLPGEAAPLDLTAELPGLRHASYRQRPLLDLVPPDADSLMHAIREIEALRQQGQPVLVHCALGLSRSTAVVAGWLYHTGRATSPQAALDLVRQRRQGTVVPGELASALIAVCQQPQLLPGCEANE